jgi:hypothetical protein
MYIYILYVQNIDFKSTIKKVTMVRIFEVSEQL